MDEFKGCRVKGSRREKKETPGRQEKENCRKLLENAVPICLSAPREENSKTSCMWVVHVRSPVRKMFLLWFFSGFLQKNNLKKRLNYYFFLHMNFELGFRYLAMISLTRRIEINEVTVARYLFTFTKIKQHSLKAGGVGEREEGVCRLLLMN